MKPDPKKSILNPCFKYTPSGQQDLAATYRRIIREMKETNKAKANIVPITQPRKESK